VKYFRSWWNRFDCFLIITSLIYTFLLPFIFDDLIHRSQTFRVLLLFRVLRLSQWFPKVERFNVLTATINQIIPTLLSFLGILLVTFYWFAVLGMTAWANSISPNNPRLVGSEFSNSNWFHISFNNFYESLVLLFTLMAVNNWHNIAKAFELVSSPWSWVYFCIFILYFSTIMISALASFILDAFVVQYKIKQMNTKCPVQSRIDQLRMDYMNNEEKDLDGIFLDKKRKRKWTVISRPDIFQLQKANVTGSN